MNDAGNDDEKAAMGNDTTLNPVTHAEHGYRSAETHDLPAIVALSTGFIARKERFIEESLGSRSFDVACRDATPIGYLIWDRAFFGRPFVWLVGVAATAQRSGIATRLFERFEGCCAGESRFTSTNESNVAMHRFLSGRGYRSSGRVENLDPDDPEIFYYKPPAAP